MYIHTHTNWMLYSAATKGSLEDECELDEEGRSAACEDYEAKKLELAKLVKAQDYTEKMNVLKKLAEEMKNIKITVDAPKASKETSAQVTAAVAAARKAAEKHGADSGEAKVAWEAVEEIASSGLQNAMGKGLDEECLVESAMEACQALEELQKALAKIEA
jgi:hypothetical protein